MLLLHCIVYRSLTAGSVVSRLLNHLPRTSLNLIPYQFSLAITCHIASSTFTTPNPWVVGVATTSLPCVIWQDRRTSPTAPRHQTVGYPILVCQLVRSGRCTYSFPACSRVPMAIAAAFAGMIYCKARSVISFLLLLRVVRSSTLLPYSTLLIRATEFRLPPAVVPYPGVPLPCPTPTEALTLSHCPLTSAPLFLYHLLYILQPIVSANSPNSALRFRRCTSLSSRLSRTSSTAVSFVRFSPAHLIPFSRHKCMALRCAS